MTTTSSSVFHSEQPGHWPAQASDSCPQSRHTYLLRCFAITVDPAKPGGRLRAPRDQQAAEPDGHRDQPDPEHHLARAGGRCPFTDSRSSSTYCAPISTLQRTQSAPADRRDRAEPAERCVAVVAKAERQEPERRDRRRDRDERLAHRGSGRRGRSFSSQESVSDSAQLSGNTPSTIEQDAARPSARRRPSAAPGNGSASDAAGPASAKARISAPATKSSRSKIQPVDSERAPRSLIQPAGDVGPVGEQPLEQPVVGGDRRPRCRSRAMSRRLTDGVHRRPHRAACYSEASAAPASGGFLTGGILGSAPRPRSPWPRRRRAACRPRRLFAGFSGAISSSLSG